MSLRLGFVGLGTMGEPMAGHLLAAHGYLTVWNRTSQKADRLASLGATVAGSVESLAEASNIILLCVTASQDVIDLTERMMSVAKPETLFIDHSTISPPVAKQVAANVERRGFRFVDAPVTGGSMGAQRGQLTVFLGGAEGDVDTAIEATKPYTKRAERVGGSGAGQMAKMANQIAVGGALLALCESLSFAQKAGLDIEQMRQMIGSGAGGSWAFENYGPKIVNKDWTPGFSILNQRKDFAYCEQAANAIDASIPGTRLVDQLLGRLQDQGHGELTTALLYEEMVKMGYADAR